MAAIVKPSSPLNYEKYEVTQSIFSPSVTSFPKTPKYKTSKLVIILLSVRDRLRLGHNACADSTHTLITHILRQSGCVFTYLHDHSKSVRSQNTRGK